MIVSGERWREFEDDILKTDLTIPESALHLLSVVIGTDVREPASAKTILAAKRWRSSLTRIRLEQSIANLAWNLTGRGTIWAVTQLMKHEMGGEVPSQYHMGVGFLGMDVAVIIPKVRTMVNQADKVIMSPFKQTAFVTIPQDGRVLPGQIAKFARRSGVDELFQLELVRRKRYSMDLVGPRGCTVRTKHNEGLKELDGLAMLREAYFAGFLSNRLSPLAKRVLETYVERMQEYKPKPAIAGALSATLGKDAPSLFRAYCDLVGCEREKSVKEWFRLLAFTAIQRVRGIGTR